MRIWVAVLALLVSAAPGIVLGSCPRNQTCAPAPVQRQAPQRQAPQRQAPQIQRSYQGGQPGRGPSNFQTRQFNLQQPQPAAQGRRQFNGTGQRGAQPRTFNSQQPRTFNSSQPRSFNTPQTGRFNQNSPGQTTGRTFRAPMAGSRRNSGSPTSSTPNSGRRFVAPASGSISASGGPRFGAGGSSRANGALGFRGANDRPRRSAGGRFYNYHGRRYARFEANRYRWPHGYGYRRYERGGYLPRAFWVQDYYIQDYGLYDLMAPPPDFQWIRYGPDILLINVETGEVAQVIPGAFAEADGGPSDDMGDQPPDAGGGQPY